MVALAVILQGRLREFQCIVVDVNTKVHPGGAVKVDISLLSGAVETSADDYEWNLQRMVLNSIPDTELSLASGTSCG